jgi:hypothetical protein
VRNALALRGLDTPEKRLNVLVTPLTPGSFGLPEESHRIVKAQMYYTDFAGINLYAKPIEGLQAIIDLDDQVVLQVIDTGPLPLPASAHNFDEASVAALPGGAPAPNPIRITQPLGTNISMNGNVVDWQKWKFHVRFERRAEQDLAGDLRRAFGPLPIAGGNPCPTRSRRELVLSHAWTWASSGSTCLAAAAGLDTPENATLIDAVARRPRCAGGSAAAAAVVGIFERLTGNPASALRTVRGRRLRRSRRRRTRRTHDRPARQLRPWWTGCSTRVA